MTNIVQEYLLEKQELGMLELVAKSLTQDDPMDSIQVGKAVFVKEIYTTLGIEPRTYS